jgi:hypothetical protein
MAQDSGHVAKPRLSFASFFGGGTARAETDSPVATPMRELSVAAPVSPARAVSPVLNGHAKVPLSSLQRIETEAKQLASPATSSQPSPGAAQVKSRHVSKGNFKCLYDPELDKKAQKGKKPTLRYDGGVSYFLCHMRYANKI